MKHWTQTHGTHVKPWRNQNADERKVTFAAYVAVGKSFLEIAALLSLDPNSLHAQCVRAGIETNHKVSEWVKLHDHAGRLARIKELDASGRSPRQIADELCTTTGAVISTAFRGDYALRSAGGLARPVPIFKVEAPVDPETWAPIHGPAVSLMANEHGCKWPVDGGCCGGTVACKSYCREHYRVAYRSAPVLANGGYDDPPRSLKPMASQAAMRIAGVPARRVERTE